MQVVFPVASHSGVQEECHFKLQDPPQQRPGSGIEKYVYKVRTGRSQRSAERKSSQVSVYCVNVKEKTDYIYLLVKAVTDASMIYIEGTQINFSLLYYK